MVGCPVSTLPQITPQLELLHAHWKDISGSTSFSGEVSVGAGSGCLARSDPRRSLGHVLLMEVHNFHWHRLGALMATEQWISVQPESDIFYLSCHQMACFQIIKHLCGEWNQAVIIFVYEHYFKVHSLHLIQILPAWMLAGWRSIHTCRFREASLPLPRCGWLNCFSSGYSLPVRVWVRRRQTEHSTASEDLVLSELAGSCGLFSSQNKDDVTALPVSFCPVFSFLPLALLLFHQLRHLSQIWQRNGGIISRRY